jgi:MATE family multidrug resistance protein
MTASQTIQSSLPSLTKHPTASLRELFSLALPLILVLLSGCLMGFCDRLFLAHYSLEAFEGCVNAIYLCIIFQLPCIRITSMAQVFVGFHKGAGNSNLIGQCVWQMIWFSLLSMLITFPLGKLVGPLFLSGTAIEKPALTYFDTLMIVNFLYPLGVALSSFFIAEGKTKALVIATLASHALNILFDFLLIFGVEGIIPPMGIFGAAVATCIAQGSFCTVLFALFLQKYFRENYGTHSYAFKWKAFWNYVQVGIPRAIARMILLVAWAAVARVMTLKGGDYLITLTVGGTLFLLFSFINEGMGQAMMTIASRLVGAKEYLTVKKLRRSAFLFLAVTMVSLSFPFLFFPEILLSFFFTQPPAPETLALLRYSCIWIWFMIFTNGVNMIGMSLITVACDTVFHMIVNCFVWLTSYLPVYLAFEVGNASPDLFWLIAAFDGLILGLIFHLRANYNNNKHTSFEKAHLSLLM